VSHNKPHLNKSSDFPPAQVTKFVFQREFKRGEAPLSPPFPLPLIKGKGDKGGWGYHIKPKGGDPVGVNQRGEVNKQSLKLAVGIRFSL